MLVALSCKKAKSTIQSLGLDDGAVGILELDEIRDGAEIQDYLESETGGSALPYPADPDTRSMLTSSRASQARGPSRACGSRASLSAATASSRPSRGRSSSSE